MVGKSSIGRRRCIYRIPGKGAVSLLHAVTSWKGGPTGVGLVNIQLAVRERQATERTTALD